MLINRINIDITLIENRLEIVFSTVLDICSFLENFLGLVLMLYRKAFNV